MFRTALGLVQIITVCDVYIILNTPTRLLCKLSMSIYVDEKFTLFKNVIFLVWFSECKYPDPLIGASPSFQARITEMAQLEVETIRFEKTKKTRKKASSS